MTLIKQNMKKLIRLSMLLVFICLSTSAVALEEVTSFQSLSDSSKDLDSVVINLRHAQSSQRNSNGSNNAYRSKSEVMSEVKRRYGGQVLRITLNEQSASYSVRVLLPNGKVRNVQVSARR